MSGESHPKSKLNPLYIVAAVGVLVFAGVGAAQAHDAIPQEHFSSLDHTDLVTADQDLNAPDVDPNKVQDFIRLGASVDKALADVTKLIAAYSDVSGPNDAPLRVLTEYRDMFTAAQHDLTLATHRVDEIQHQFNAYHTTTSALRMAKEIHLPNPTEFNNTYGQLAQFYDNLSPGEFVLPKSDVVAKDLISSHIQFKDVAPAPVDPIQYLGHVPDKPALIPPALGYILNDVTNELPKEIKNDFWITAGNGETALHETNSCHYRTPLTCVDGAFISKTKDPVVIGTALKIFNEHGNIDHTHYEVTTHEKFVETQSKVRAIFGDTVAKYVTENPNATNDHLHIVAKSK